MKYENKRMMAEKIRMEMQDKRKINQSYKMNKFPEKKLKKRTR